MRRLTVALVLVATVSLAGCTGYGGSDTGDTPQTGDQTDGQDSAPAVEQVSGVTPDRTIDLTNYEFSAASPEVSAGTVIEFRNVEGSHTITLDAAGIDVTVSGSDSVALRFNEAGTYQVYCRFHGSSGSGMHSDVTVGDTGGGTSDDSGGGSVY